jgi:hypothetical protein
LPQKTFQSSAKLHGLKRCEGECVGILVVKTEIANDPWTPVVLRHNAKGGNAKMGQRTGDRVWEDGPILLVDKVDHLLVEKIKKFVTRGMGAAVDGRLNTSGGPRRGTETDRGAVEGILFQNAFGGVGDTAQIGKVGSGAKLLNKTREAWGGFEASNSIIN